MEHQIFINSNNFIEAHIIGNVSSAEIVNLGQRLVSFVTILENGGHKINILIDYTRGTNTDEFAVTLAKSIVKSLQFHKVAGFDANESTTKIVKEITKTSNLENKIRLFQTRQEAETWLKE